MPPAKIEEASLLSKTCLGFNLNQMQNFQIRAILS